MARIDPYLFHYFEALRDLSAPEVHIAGREKPDLIPMLIRVVDAAEIPKITDIEDCHVTSGVGNIVACLGSLATVEVLENNSRVISVEASRRSSGYDCSKSVPFVHADRVQNDPQNPEKGDRALVAVIDAGIDVLHEAFQDTNQRTRIAAIWDQTDSTGPGPIMQGRKLHGTLHSQSDIDGYISSGKVPSGLGRDPRHHGTHQKLASKKADEYLALPQISKSMVLDLALSRARLISTAQRALSVAQIQNTLDRVLGLPPDLRLAEWIVLVIESAPHQDALSALVEQLKKVHVEISADVWKSNESLERRVQANLRVDLHIYNFVDVRVSSPLTFNDDVNERHGPFVLTRGTHVLELPTLFRMGAYPVTNWQFLAFVNESGYAKARMKGFTQDGKTFGPSTWPSSSRCNSGWDNHPVSGISYIEARAYVDWLNVERSDPSWIWCLPSEDMWEVAARSARGFEYPWGSGFLSDHCNSIEGRFNETTEVGRFPKGNSFCGCADMAGNVWEFVEANDSAPAQCVLRGGSFRNNSYEIRSYLRLTKVPVNHRPSDFGLRCAQISPASRQSRGNSKKKK